MRLFLSTDGRVMQNTAGKPVALTFNTVELIGPTPSGKQDSQASLNVITQLIIKTILDQLTSFYCQKKNYFRKKENKFQATSSKRGCLNTHSFHSQSKKTTTTTKQHWSVISSSQGQLVNKKKNPFFIKEKSLYASFTIYILFVL